MNESPELSSHVVARNPLSDDISLHADSMVGLVPEHLGRGPSDVGNVVSNNPLSDSTLLYAERIVGLRPIHLAPGPSDVLSVVGKPLSGSCQDDEDVQSAHKGTGSSEKE